MAWRLYYISLLPLFGFIAVKYFEPDSFVWLYNRDWNSLKCEHYAFMVAVVFALFAIVLLLQMIFRTRSRYEISGAKIIGKPLSLNHEMIGVLSSVVLPFLTVNFTTMRECAASIFVIVLRIISCSSEITSSRSIRAMLRRSNNLSPWIT